VVQYGYRMSKAAAHMAAWNMSGDLLGKGVAVGIVHPGVVESDMTKKTQSKTELTPEESAKHILDILAKITLDCTGSFFDYLGNTMLW
jgi:NAD(P)-dependent dehydrogenase (short-subunit alcohol dehydrogenase family)